MANRIGEMLAAFVVVMSVGATAKAEESYLSLYTGYSVTDSPDLYTYVGDIPHELDSGMASGGALGIRLDDGVRLEVEMMYRMNAVDTIGGLPGAGRVSAISAMFNIIGEFDLFVGSGGLHDWLWRSWPEVGVLAIYRHWRWRRTIGV